MRAVHIICMVVVCLAHMRVWGYQPLQEDNGTCILEQPLQLPNLKLCNETQHAFCLTYHGLHVNISILLNEIETLRAQINVLQTAPSPPPPSPPPPPPPSPSPPPPPSPSPPPPPSPSPPPPLFIVQQDSLPMPRQQRQQLRCDLLQVVVLPHGETCPCGFVNMGTEHGERYLALSPLATGPHMGTSPVGSLETHTHTLPGTVNAPQCQMDQIVRGQFPLKTPRCTVGPQTTSSTLHTVNAAPALAIVLCERRGPCICE